MKPRMTLLVCALSLTAIGAARPTFCHESTSSNHPTGTLETKRYADNNEVQPAGKQVGFSSDVIRSAQEILNENTSKAGAPTGTMNM